MWIFALAAGSVAAVVDAASMIPLPFPSSVQKRQAMTAAFVERFFLGSPSAQPRSETEA